MRVQRKSSSGFQVVQAIGLMLLTIMISALAIDFGFYYAVQNQMQTAADAAAMAATSEMYRDVSVDPEDRMASARAQAVEFVDENQRGLVLDDEDVVFGFIDPATKIYNQATFRTPSSSSDYTTTGGYNAVWVRVRRGTGSSNEALNTVMANFFGVHTTDAQATSVALLDQTVDEITNGGLRPIYACEAQFRRTMEDGISSNNVVRIYGDHTTVDGEGNTPGCPAMGSGNWGFADLGDCSSGSVGASTIREWFANGYPGTVNAGQCYSTKPGNFISSISDELDTLIANETIFPIPLYDGWSGNGSNGQVDVSGFVGFQITSYVANGSQANRHIEGRFVPYNCGSGCRSTGAAGPAPGGAIVKLRLASRS